MTLIIISYRTRSIKLTKRLQPRGAHRSSLAHSAARKDNHCHVKIYPPPSRTPHALTPSPTPLLVDVNRHNLSSILLFCREWRAERNTAAAVRWLIKLGYPDLWGRGYFAYNHPVSKPPSPTACGGRRAMQESGCT